MYAGAWGSDGEHWGGRSGDANYLLRLPDRALKIIQPTLTGFELGMFTLAMLRAQRVKQRLDDAHNGWKCAESCNCAACIRSTKRKRSDEQ